MMDGMETTMLTLTDFLLARIAKDEARAYRRVATADAPHRWTDDRLAHGEVGVLVDGRREVMSVEEFEARFTRAGEPDHRLLRECEAKRRIVELHSSSGEHEPGHVPGYFCEACADWSRENDEGQPPTVPWPCPTLRSLAAVYANHPGCREEWLP